MRLVQDTKRTAPKKTCCLDFCGDQVVSYLLEMAPKKLPARKRMRLWRENVLQVSQEALAAKLQELSGQSCSQGMVARIELGAQQPNIFVAVWISRLTHGSKDNPDPDWISCEDWAPF